MGRRIRTIKPEWLEDERLASASDEARVLSVALILIADDHGRGRASIAMLAAEVWRYELQRDDGANARETLAKASRAYRELLAIGFASSYEVSGQAYFEIRNWSRHQKIDRPSAPKVPPPNRSESLDSRDTRETLARDSRDTRETLATDQDQDQDQDQDRDPSRVRGRARARAREGEGIERDTPKGDTPSPAPSPPTPAELPEPDLSASPRDLRELPPPPEPPSPNAFVATNVLRDFAERWIREATRRGGTGIAPIDGLDPRDVKRAKSIVAKALAAHGDDETRAGDFYDREVDGFFEHVDPATRLDRKGSKIVAPFALFAQGFGGWRNG